MASRLRRFEFALVLSGAAIALAMAAGASAATIRVTGGTVVFRAAPGEANHVSMVNWKRPGQCGIVVSLCVADLGAPLTVGPGCEQLDANSAACPEDVQDPRLGRPLLAFGGDADDVLREESERRAEVTLWGGSGDDGLYSGSGAGKSPSLYGGPGDDTVYVRNNGAGTPIMRGGPGNDELCSCEHGGGLLYGEAGDDRLLISNDSPSVTMQTLDGGPGNDSYVARERVYMPGVAPGPGADVLDGSQLSRGTSIDLRECRGCVEWVIGSPGDDEITGYAGRQVLVGGEGFDVIRGLGGPDVLAGQDGDDTMYSRDRRVDTVSCGAGADTAFADANDAVSPNCENVNRRTSQTPRHRPH